MLDDEGTGYAFSRGKFYDLYMNDGSNDERSRAVIRFKPYFHVEISSHVPRSDVSSGFKYRSQPITSDPTDMEEIPRALQAAGLSGEILEDMFSGLSLPTSLSEYPSIEKLLERGEQEAQKTLTSVCISAWKKNLTWKWVEKHCSETEHNLIDPVDRHFLFLQLTHSDDSYAVSQQTPITIKQAPGTSAHMTRPSFSGNDLGNSSPEQWVELYPVIRKRRTDPDGSSSLHLSVVAVSHVHSRAPWVPQLSTVYPSHADIPMQVDDHAQFTAEDEMFDKVLGAVMDWSDAISESANNTATRTSQ